jgi:GT2 family glycosyltransferase
MAREEPVNGTGPGPRLYGVLVTFRRPDQLASMLSAVSGQTRPLEHLVVVDNAPTADTRAIVRTGAPAAEYVASPENLGPAGGIALGMERVLERADDRDWVLTLDDDDPPHDREVFDMLHAFAAEVTARDEPAAAVGLAGGRFDRRRGRMIRVPDEELHGAVSVDCIAGNLFPCYSIRAVRAVGVPQRDLFFGLEELEFGLRLRDAGYSLYGHGHTWHENRLANGRIGARLAPARSLGDATWRRYYSLRNLVRILRDRGETAAAVRVTLVAGIGKPVANLARDPGGALRHLRLNARACRDAWSHRMGRTVEPTT